MLMKLCLLVFVFEKYVSFINITGMTGRGFFLIKQNTKQLE